MELQVSHIGSVQILALSASAGRFDAHTAPPLASWLDQVSAQLPAQVVVNLEHVYFIDSTALATLVRGMKRCRQQGGDLHLCALQSPVRIIFELTRMDRAFSLFPTVEQAVAGFAS